MLNYCSGPADYSIFAR